MPLRCLAWAVWASLGRSDILRVSPELLMSLSGFLMSFLGFSWVSQMFCGQPRDRRGLFTTSLGFSRGASQRSKDFPAVVRVIQDLSGLSRVPYVFSWVFHRVSLGFSWLLTSSPQLPLDFSGLSGPL